jgi:uncharacterized protein YjdB
MDKIKNIINKNFDLNVHYNNVWSITRVVTGNVTWMSTESAIEEVLKDEIR